MSGVVARLQKLVILGTFLVHMLETLLAARVRRYKLFALWGAIIAFLFSIATPVLEARYLMFGQVVQATAKTVNENNGRWRISYTFADADGSIREESDSGSGEIETRPALGGRVNVQYIPGSAHDSRLVGHSKWLWTIPFLTSLVVIVVVSWRFMREYREHERRNARIG